MNKQTARVDEITGETIEPDKTRKPTPTQKITAGWEPSLKTTQHLKGSWDDLLWHAPWSSRIK
jgi:hypothetical protein